MLDLTYLPNMANKQESFFPASHCFTFSIWFWGQVAGFNLLGTPTQSWASGLGLWKHLWKKTGNKHYVA